MAWGVWAGRDIANGIKTARRIIQDPEFREDYFERSRQRDEESASFRLWIGKYIFIPFMLVLLFFEIKHDLHVRFGWF